MLTESQQQIISDLTKNFESINDSFSTKKYERFNMAKINESLSLKDEYLQSVVTKNLAIAQSLYESIRRDFANFNEEFGSHFVLIEGSMGFASQRWNTPANLIQTLTDSPASVHYHGAADVFIGVKGKRNLDTIPLKVSLKQIKNPIKLPDGKEVSASEVIGLEWKLSGRSETCSSLEELIQESSLLQQLMTSKVNG
jgi:hypothetical protein